MGNSVKNKNAKTIFEAIEQNNIKKVSQLIESGVDINQIDEANWSPLVLAIKQNKVEIAKLLINSGAELHDTQIIVYDSLYLAITSGMNDLVKLMVKKGADLEKTFFCDTPLMTAINTKNLSLINYFISLNVGINKPRTIDGQTPLLESIKQKLPSVSLALVKAGADVNQCNKNPFSALDGIEIWRSPLMSASEKGYLDVVSALVQAGAKINEVGAERKAALQLAFSAKKDDIVQFLANNGAIIPKRLQTKITKGKDGKFKIQR